MMLNLSNALRATAFSGFIALGAVGVVSQPAAAGGYGEACHGPDCARVYCDESGYHCYEVQHAGRDYDEDDRGGYRNDWSDYRDRRDYDDRDYDGYRGRHYVCDSDGDRCYATSAGYWNYREYYRRLGYHWND